MATILDSKQKSILKTLAHRLHPTVYIGKNGVIDSVLADANVQLEAKELVKCSILRSSPVSASDTALELAFKLKAELISCLGNKIVLYRKSNKKGVRHIEF